MKTESNVGHDVTTCGCRLCTKRRTIEEREARGVYLVPSDPPQRPRETRRGKPVVSKGCKGCHSAR